MNTRRYPRTLAEAFPQDAAYACAVERSARKRPAVWIALAIGLALIAWRATS